MSAVSPFDTKDECIQHAAHLFQNWSTSRESEENQYHRMDAGIHYLEIHMGEYSAAWSCIPNISRHLGLNNIPQSFKESADAERIPRRPG